MPGGMTPGAGIAPEELGELLFPFPLDEVVLRFLVATTS